MARSFAKGASLVLLLTPSLTCPMPARSESRAAELRNLLDQTVSFNGFDDSKLTLQEALDFLAGHYGLAFDVNEQAFREAQVQDVLATPIVEKPIPRLFKVSLATVLRKVLSRVPGDATYVVRENLIEITVPARVAESRDARRIVPLPQVSAEFDRKPLAEALGQLTAEARVSVVLDVRAAEQGKSPVTADLIDVPLDTAVQVLADMAGLKPVRLGNMIYVTTRENAKLLQQEQRERSLMRSMGGIKKPE